jgi:DNA-binding Lrp family transcriptional regulator
MELDTLDKKIIYLLDQDGRAGYKELAKATRSSPEVMRYRVRRLLENNIIKNFMTLVNFSEFGYVGHGVFCRFSTEEGREELIQYLKEHPRIYWIAEFGGRYDLAFAVMAKDSLEFYEKLQKIKERASDKLLDWDIAIRIQLNQFPRTYLLDTQEKRKKQAPYFGKEIHHYSLDYTDIAILKEISQNARIETIELSNKINVPPSTVAFRIKKLKQNNVIQGFSPQTVCQNFGYQSFQLFISVDKLDLEKRKRLFNYCLSNPNIVFLIETLGKWNFEIIYETKDQKVFQKEMIHLRQELSWITNVEMGVIFDHYVKYNHFPLEKKEM